MFVEGALAPRSAEPAEVALIVALGIERACVAAYLRSPNERMISLHQCGPGASRAAEAAEAAVSAGATALVSWGLAGALESGVAPGSVVLPRTVVQAAGDAFTADESWRSRLAEDLSERFEVIDGPLLATPDVLGTPGMKARAAVASRAVAVDMESGAIARIAARTGVPFVVLRVIADGLADTLPAGVERWIDEAGNRRLAPVVDAALRPAHWRNLWVLARRYRTARRTLDDLARELAPQGFLFRSRSTLQA